MFSNKEGNPCSTILLVYQPRSSRFSFVTSYVWASILVHPCTTVMYISTVHKARVPVNAYFTVEAFVCHVLVNALTSIPFPVFEAIRVALERFLNHLGQSLILQAKQNQWYKKKSPIPSNPWKTFYLRSTLNISLGNTSWIYHTICMYLKKSDLLCC